MMKKKSDGLSIQLKEIIVKLQDKRAWIRQSTLVELLVIESDIISILEPISVCLSDVEKDTRLLAIPVLEKTEKHAVPYLIAAIGLNQPREVRISAISALGRLKNLAIPAIELLCECLHEEDSVLRINAGLSLSQIGIAILPSLKIIMQSSDERAKEAAVNAIGWIGIDAHEFAAELKTVAEEASPFINIACQAALVKITGLIEEGLPNLLSELDNPTPLIREKCVECIGELGELAVEAFPALLTRLQDPSGPVRAAAALALIRIKANCPETVDSLISLLSDEDCEAKKNAGIALATIGPPAEAALPTLNMMKSDSDEFTVCLVKVAINKIIVDIYT